MYFMIPYMFCKSSTYSKHLTISNIVIYHEPIACTMVLLLLLTSFLDFYSRYLCTVVYAGAQHFTQFHFPPGPMQNDYIFTVCTFRFSVYIYLSKVYY